MRDADVEDVEACTERSNSANFPWAAVIIPSVIVLLIGSCVIYCACCGKAKDQTESGGGKESSGNAVHPQPSFDQIEDPVAAEKKDKLCDESSLKGDNTITTAPTEATN